MLNHLERTGYAEALRAAGIRFDKALCIAAGISEEGAAEAVRRLLKLADPRTAIVCRHDLIALGALRGTAETGKMPGHERRRDRRSQSSDWKICVARADDVDSR